MEKICYEVAFYGIRNEYSKVRGYGVGIIRSIEIKYFRSLYTLKIRNLRELNVFSGRNDVGKSNILKALNLFFNGKTDWQADVDFYRDFNAQRLSEVRKESIKGKQFISIAIEFQRTEGYKGSLPESFIVKRTWHRDGKLQPEQNNLDSLYKYGKIPPKKLNTAKRFLQVFLNRVHFEYVPAAKDRLYHQYLLTRLQKSILNIPTTADAAISQITESLAKHIEQGVDELRQDFQQATDIVSAIEPPHELGSLFQAFGVSTDSQSGDRIPLALRGDGIQARYMLSVLYYICKSSSDFFIWGLEEPENSLEYSRVIKITDDLLNSYSKIAQVFLTTHSPALTAIRSDNSTCFRISCGENGLSKAVAVWPERGTNEQRTQLSIEMGFMTLEENMHKELVTKSQEVMVLQEHIQDIEQHAAQV